MRGQAAGFEVFEHTADAGIVAWGETLADAFDQAARGMYSLMVDIDRVESTETRQIALRSPDRERLLADWLQELLFLTETEGLVFAQFDVRLDPSGCVLEATVGGEPLDVSRHEPAYDIKAVTRHQLKVEREANSWRVRVLFDI